MADRSLDALAQALAADPPKAVDPDAVAAADRLELAAALRRAVADLPAAEQRTRLAGAFRAISTPPSDPTAAPQPARRGPIQRSLSGLRNVNASRAGLLAGVLVVSLVAGVLTGAATGSDAPERAAPPDAAVDPVPVLEPVAQGDDPPGSDFASGFLPPDPEAQADAMREAVENRADELGADVEDVDPDAVAAPVGDQVVEPVAGYADGSSFFGEDASAGEDAGPEAGQGGSGEPGDAESSGSPGPSGSADPIEAGSDPEPPALVDVCAGDEAPDACEGVGGTVTLASVEAFRFNFDPKAVTYWPGCVGRRDLAPDEFIIELQTNNLGSFTARYRLAGTDAAFTEVTGDSPVIWREALDVGSVAQVVTCLVAERPDDPDALRLEVEIVGEGAQDSGTASFTGLLDLAEAPEPEPEPERREGRPPVSARALTASTLEVTVPVGQDENAEVSLVPRDPEGGGDDCVDPNPATVVEAEPSGSVVARRADEDITLVLDWTEATFEVSAPEAGPYSVCVAWFDDVEPPRNLERASIPVDIAGVASGEVLLAGWQPPEDGGEQPATVAVAARTGRSCSPGTRTIDDPQGQPAPDRGEPDVLCSFDGAPGYIGITSDSTFGDGDLLTQRALLAVPDSCGSSRVRDRWDSRGDGSCTTWFLQTIKRPDRSVAGAVVIGIRLDAGAGPDSVVVGDERPEHTDQPDFGGPRLRWGQVSAEPDPSNPSRRAIVQWATDEQSRVTIQLTPQSSTDSCPAKTTTLSDPSREASTSVRGLCPGISYYVSFDLEADSGRTVYDSWNPHNGLGPEVGIIRRSAVLTMDPLPVTFDYQLTFEETLGGETVNKGVVPTRMNLQFPQDATGGAAHSYDYAQYFDGHARFELDCSNPSHFNRSESGINLNLRGGRFYLAESSFQLETYYPTSRGIFDGGPGRRCPTLYNQVNHTPTDPRRACPVRVGNLAPVGETNTIDAMLSGGTGEFTASVPMCSSSANRQFTVTLTVQMRESRTLRGRVG